MFSNTPDKCEHERLVSKNNKLSTHKNNMQIEQKLEHKTVINGAQNSDKNNNTNNK